MVQIAFCDLSYNFHKMVTSVYLQNYVILRQRFSISPITLILTHLAHFLDVGLAVG